MGRDLGSTDREQSITVGACILAETVLLAPVGVSAGTDFI
jgi:hypothetical protein